MNSTIISLPNQVILSTSCPPIPGQALAAVRRRLAGIAFGPIEVDQIVGYLAREGTLAGAPFLGPLSEEVAEEAFVAALPPVGWDDPAWGPGWTAEDEAFLISTEAPDGRDVARKLLDSGRLDSIADTDEWNDAGELPLIEYHPTDADLAALAALDDDTPLPTDDDLQHHRDYQRWLDSIAGVPDDQPEPEPRRDRFHPDALANVRRLLWGPNPQA